MAWTLLLPWFGTGWHVQEQLRMILEAEAEARQQLEAAQRECQFLLAQAEEEGRRRVCEAREVRDTIIRSEEERLAAEAEEKARRVEETARTRGAAMRSLAQSRMDRAVAAVLQCVLGQSEGHDW